MTRTLHALLALALAQPVLPAFAQTCRTEPIGQVAATFGENEPALQAVIWPFSIVGDREGNVYFFDLTNYRVRKLSTDGVIRTVAGNGRYGSDGDGGPATQARVAATSIALAADGTVFLTDGDRVRRVNRAGIIETVAGTGIAAFNGESGPARAMHLNGPTGLTTDSAGNLYFADRNNHRIRRLSPDGQLTTIAGSTRRPGTSDDVDGDGGPALQAALHLPNGAFLLNDGRLIISDNDGNRIRRVDPDGVIQTIARYGLALRLRLHPNGTLYAYGRGLNRLTLAGELIPEPAFGSLRILGDYNFLPTGQLVYTSATQTSSANTSFLDNVSRQLWLFDGTTERLMGGRMLVVDPTAEGPASNTYFSPSLMVTRRDGAVYLVQGVRDQGAIVFLLGAGQTVTRVLGGGSDEGDPDGKPALSLKLNFIYEIGATPDGALLVAVVIQGQPRFLRVAGGEVRVIRNQAGSPMILEALRTRLTNSRTIETDNAGNIFVLSGGRSSGSGAGELVDVTVVQPDGATRRYSGENLRSLVRLPDGGVAAAVNNGFRYLRLGVEGVGERVSLFEGPLGFQRAFAGGYVYALEGFALFRRSLSGRPWQRSDLDVSASGPMGAGPDGSLIHSSRLPNLWRISQPAACPAEIGPIVQAGSIVNAASYAQPDVAAPGQLMTLFGENLGPDAGHGLFFGPFGTITEPPTGAIIRIGGFPATGVWFSWREPVLFANPTQINFQVPYELQAGRDYDVAVYWNGFPILYPNRLRIEPASPGLFTLTGRDGPGAILNQDGSINSAVNPAAAGSVISLFATGLGETTPPSETGALTGLNPLPRLARSVLVRVGGREAVVEYAGGAPGLISGLTQINVRLPEGVSGQAAPVSIEVAGRSTETVQRVTVAIR